MVVANHNVVKKHHLARCLGVHSYHCPCCELLTIVLLEDSFNVEFTNMSNALNCDAVITISTPKYMPRHMKVRGTVQHVYFLT